MSLLQVARRLAEARGITLTELLIGTAVFMLVVLGIGSLYLSARRGLDIGGAEAFVQRQGTLVQDRLTRELRTANSIQVATCGEVPGSMSANKSIIYTLVFPGRTTNATEFWCIYEFKRPSLPFSTLWRCPLANASANQTCTGSPPTVSAENLLPPVPDSVAGQRVEVLNSTFCFTGISPCAGPAPVARSVDIRFEMDLHPSNSTDSLLYGPRAFGFSVAFRN